VSRILCHNLSSSPARQAPHSLAEPAGFA